jgi:hypothetical protein
MVAGAQSAADLEFTKRILRASDAEQVAAVRAFLDEGLRPVAQEQGIQALARAHSELVLPVLEKKIEEVLRSQNPLDSFSNKNANPDLVIYQTASYISEGDAGVAMAELSKLVSLDEKRFAIYVFKTLSSLAVHENAFTLAYKGFDNGIPALSRAIFAWPKSILEGPTHSNAPHWAQWADVLVERYRGVPIGPEWASDPIVSRLTPARAETLQPEMLRLAQDAWERSPLRLAALSDSEQIALAKSLLDRDIPYDKAEVLAALARSHSSLVLPLIEAKVEGLLKSPDQIELRSPDRFLVTAIGIIARTGDLQALRQLVKLRKNTPMTKRYFQGMVSTTFGFAAQRNNPYTFAYQGLGIGDAELDETIVLVAGLQLAEPSQNTTRDQRRLCLAAMRARYGGHPTPEQWAKDPLISGLKPGLAESLHGDMVRIAAEAAK